MILALALSRSRFHQSFHIAFVLALHLRGSAANVIDFGKQEDAALFHFLRWRAPARAARATIGAHMWPVNVRAYAR